MATRTEPLSIESLLQKQKAEREAASKVYASRFLNFQTYLILTFTAQVPLKRRTSKACHRKTGTRDQRAKRKGRKIKAGP